MPLQDSKDLNSILSIMKVFHSHPVLPAECLTENVTLDLLPRKRWMVCQNTLIAEK